MGIELTDEQIFLTLDLEHWFHSNDSKQTYEISGPSGSGKTTVIKYVIEKLGLKYDNVLFVAMAGKAANQMALHGLPAKTIHSAIYDYIEEYLYDEHGRFIRYSNGKPKKTHKFVLKDKLPKKIKLIVVDEGSMVGERLAKDLMSFGIPMIILGDLNQLPPVMDTQFFLNNPDFRLTKIMRQHEGNPIIYLSQRILHDEPLNYGLYRESAVIRKSDLDLLNFKNTDITLVGTNKLKDRINDLYRQNVKHYTDLEKPHVGEKVICTKNNWNMEVNGLFLTNGTSGYISDVDKFTYDKFSINISMVPDFAPKSEFRDLDIDYINLNRIDLNSLSEKDKVAYSYREKILNKIEYAYAISVHRSQGSEYDRVLFMDENVFPKDTQKKLEYTAITRAKKQIIIVK